jgi:hypothetical protein
MIDCWSEGVLTIVTRSAVLLRLASFTIHDQRTICQRETAAASLLLGLEFSLVAAHCLCTAHSRDPNCFLDLQRLEGEVAEAQTAAKLSCYGEQNQGRLVSVAELEV